MRGRVHKLRVLGDEGDADDVQMLLSGGRWRGTLGVESLYEGCEEEKRIEFVSGELGEMVR